MKETPTILIRPWGDVWQYWYLQPKDSSWQLEKKAPEFFLEKPLLTLCALPSRQVISVPFWIESTDREVIEEMTRLELEIKGLIPPDRSQTDVLISCLREDAGRTMVRAIIFPQEIPNFETAEQFLANPLIGDLTPDMIHLWVEQEDIVAVACSQEGVVCWETMHRSASSAELRSWLRCLVLQLESENFMIPSAPVKDWAGLHALLPQERGHPETSEKELEEGPSLLSTSRLSAWQHASGREQQERRNQQSKVVKAASLVAGGIFLLVAAVIAHALTLEYKIHKTQSEVTRLESEAGPLKASALRWSLVEYASDPRLFPLENLHNITTALPPDEVKLTVFEFARDVVSVQGEAKNAGAATKFFNKLRETDLGMNWTMASPILLPNNSAQFVIEGRRNGYAPAQ